MNTPQEPKQKTEQTSKEVFLDFVSEIVGYEKGLYKTFSDLRKQPRVVVESYLAKENIYTSPFKLLITVATVWLLVNNLVIDWGRVLEDNSLSMFNFMVTHLDDNPKPMSPQDLNNIRLLSKVAGELISKYYIVFVLLTTPLWAYLCYVFCKPFKIDFRTHLVVVGYHYSLILIPTLIFSWCIAINFGFAFILGIIIELSKIFGKSVYVEKIYSIVPLRNFFAENGVSVEKRYYYARYIVLIVFMVALTNWFYQVLTLSVK